MGDCRLFKFAVGDVNVFVINKWVFKLLHLETSDSGERSWVCWNLTDAIYAVFTIVSGFAFINI